MKVPDIVLNDSSFNNHPVPSLAAARSAFEEFVSTVGALIDEGVCNAVIRSQFCLQDACIRTAAGDEWTVENWLVDVSVDREMRSFVLALDTKVPVEDGRSLSEEEELALMAHDYRVAAPDGPSCYASGFALCTGDVVASVRTHSLWDVHQLDVCVCEEASVLRRATVDHASREEHCGLLAKLFQDRLFDSVTTAAEFKLAKATLFPNLRFSPDVDQQVEVLEALYLCTALEKLSKMNETARLWTEAKSAAPEYRFQWSRESASTMENPVYRKAREFRIPEGGTAIFENHVYFSDRHRIHFIEDRTARDFIVGYIGDHLPTVRFPH